MIDIQKEPIDIYYLSVKLKSRITRNFKSGKYRGGENYYPPKKHRKKLLDAQVDHHNYEAIKINVAKIEDRDPGKLNAYLFKPLLLDLLTHGGYESNWLMQIHGRI